MKNSIIALAVLVILALGSGLVYEHEKSDGTDTSTSTSEIGGGTVCAQDAMQCADGSYVGRTGPNCQFVCPEGSTTTQPVSTGNTAKLNQTIVVNGISITPLSVVEDSRCPTNVQCIQAGTVRITAKLQSGTTAQTVTLRLNTPTAFAGKSVTLSEVTPVPNTTVEKKDSDYRFTFSVTGSASSKGTLNGNVTIGPVCPVEVQDQSCKPTAQMYAAAKVLVYSKEGGTLLKTLTPDAQGNFSTSLSSGTYYIDMIHQAIGGTTGVPTTITVLPGKTVTLALHVDTGIR